MAKPSCSLLADLHREGSTICMVTHDPRFAQATPSAKCICSTARWFRRTSSAYRRSGSVSSLWKRREASSRIHVVPNRRMLIRRSNRAIIVTRNGDGIPLRTGEEKQCVSKSLAVAQVAGLHAHRRAHAGLRHRRHHRHLLHRRGRAAAAVAVSAPERGWSPSATDSKAWITAITAGSASRARSAHLHTRHQRFLEPGRLHAHHL
jgi:hypothetical protein